jgi:uncharacterized damage-inducible protein DinB
MNRQLAQLKDEIKAYVNESDLWIKTGEIPNSAGNLCLHLCGNLQHFIGAVLGNSGYVRQRDEEFSRQDVAAGELLAEVDKTIDIITNTLQELDESKLAEPYPQDVLGKALTIEYFLIHLTSHLSYHLGQINYHRRLLAGS